MASLYVFLLQGQLQVLSIFGGSAESTDAKKIGLNPDDKGIYAHKLQVLLELDVDNEDFVFQQGTVQSLYKRPIVFMIP